MVPACGSWRCGGIAWAFPLEIGFGRGRTFSWKPSCKSGRAGTERMRFTCSHQLREAENGKCRLITGLTCVFSLFTHARFDRSARYHLTLCASLRGHTRSHEIGFSVVASADHAGQRRHRLEHGRYQGRFNFRETGCHSTQPAPNPSMEALDKALLLLFAARGC